MPYRIEKVKGGFKLVDNKGHYYSNKPMTKKAVQSQMKAIEISKHKHHNHPLYPQYVKETGDISGAGFTDWLKKKASDISGRISGFITGVRDDYPPQVRDILKKYGNNKITKIVVRRDPLSKAVDVGINVLTLGEFDKSKKEAGYDNYYHLYMIATLDNGINLLMEKNEVIKIEPYNKNPELGDKFDVQMFSPIVLNDFLNNGLKGQGKQLFFYYDPFTANCQIWINGLMTFNGLLKNNPNLQKFIMQDYRTLIQNIPPATRSLMSGITSLARRFNILTQGKGFDFHPLHNMV